jgi:hypothetical protein
LNNQISLQEKNDALKRMKKILQEFEDALKRAEIIYKEAVEKGDLDLQKRLMENIIKIKREEATIQNLINGICEISD